MPILGIDIGGSTAQVILFNKNKIKYLFSKDNPFSLDEIEKILIKYRNYSIALTGGGAKKIKKALVEEGVENNLNIIDEILAIGIGGSFLSKKKEALIVSLGTGTAMVKVQDGKIEHIGGTGIGGGTIKGLAHFLFKKKNLHCLSAAKGGKEIYLFDYLEKIAKTGKREKIDLKIKDIVGGPIGKIPANLTASNFGQVNYKSPPPAYRENDLSLALFNMVAEVVATLAFFGAKNYHLEKKIVFGGGVAENKIIKKRLKETVQFWGGKAQVLEKARYICAVGAAKSLS
jgi:type II pantothenate kinase